MTCNRIGAAEWLCYGENEAWWLSWMFLTGLKMDKVLLSCLKPDIPIPHPWPDWNRPWTWLPEEGLSLVLVAPATRVWGPPLGVSMWTREIRDLLLQCPPALAPLALSSHLETHAYLSPLYLILSPLKGFRNHTEGHNLEGCVNNFLFLFF